ncbi:MAG: tetratricopeptide repeat protein [Bacteroidia bacterium]|nr:tetratricopeptide repeat protein [Bacteroidia bacterium]
MIICHVLCLHNIGLCQSIPWQEIHKYLTDMQYKKMYENLPYVKNNIEDKAIAEYIVFHSYIIQSLLINPKTYENKVKYYYENVQYYCQRLPNHNPYKEYLIAEMDCEIAIIYIQQRKYWDAIWKAKSGYQKLMTCVQKFPNFYEPYKTLGIMHTAIGNIPKKYAWAASALGFKGTVKQGEEELLLCIQKGDLQQIEAQLAYAYLCINMFLKRDKALEIATEMPKNYPDSKFISTLCALVCTKLNQDEAGAFIIDKLKAFNLKSEYLDFAFAEYLMAEYALHKNHLQEAIQNYKKYLQKNQNDLFKADSYFKIGLCYELQNKRSHAISYYEKSILEPNNEQEEDRQSQKYAQQLLKKPLSSIEKDLRIARNYADGGYYESAFQQIEHYQHILPNYSPIHQLEWHYRMARIYHVQKNWDKALVHYQKATEINQEIPSWMQVFAWYYMGTIYEIQKNRTLAKFCYEKALSYDNYEYQNSLERRTKAALQRVKEL